MVNRVLVPFTDSEDARQALKHALTSFSDAEITVIHVVSFATYSGHEGISVRYVEDISEEGERLLEQAQEIADEHGKTIETELLQGNPKHKITQYAEESEADHIVMGSRGRSGISRLLLGSVAETVVRRSPVPVTVVR